MIITLQNPFLTISYGDNTLDEATKLYAALTCDIELHKPVIPINDFIKFIQKYNTVKESFTENDYNRLRKEKCL